MSYMSSSPQKAPIFSTTIIYRSTQKMGFLRASSHCEIKGYKQIKIFYFLIKVFVCLRMCIFCCTFAPHSVKGSRWESYTDPLLWFAISFVSYLSHCLSGGKAKQTSNKSEDLLHATLKTAFGWRKSDRCTVKLRLCRWKIPESDSLQSKRSDNYGVVIRLPTTKWSEMWS